MPQDLPHFILNLMHMGRRYGLPLVLTAHSRYDLLLTSRVPLAPLPFYRALLRPYLRWLTSHYDLVIAPTSEAVRVLHDLGVGCSIEVIPYGIDQARVCPRRVARSDLELPDSASVAVFLGRLVVEKNVAFLLQALARPELAQAYLVVVGDGPDRDRLRAYSERLGLNGRVRFVGRVSPTEVSAYTALADLCVTASKIEMLPLAILEALVAGLPIVGLDVPWIRDVVQPGVNGLLAGPQVGSFARAWAMLAQDESLRARLSDGARAVSQRYDARQTMALIVKQYERLVARSDRRRRE